VHENLFWGIQPPYRRATGIFSAYVRRIVAQDVLIIAERLRHRALTTGHILLAILECNDLHVREIISSLPDIREVTAAVIEALPGKEDT
jgi:hypothetical protein